MDKLKQFRFELNRSINQYGKESIGADEVLEMLDLIIDALEPQDKQDGLEADNG